MSHTAQSISAEDTAALGRVLAALRQHPDLIHRQHDLAELRTWAEQHGAHFQAYHADAEAAHASRGGNKEEFHHAHSSSSSSSSSESGNALDDEDEEEVSANEPESESEPDTELWEVSPEADDTAESTDAHAEAATGEEVSEEVEEQAMSLKAEAAELAVDPDTLAAAIEKMSAALQLVPHNSMYWGLRALYQLRAKHAAAALRDANRALQMNAQNVRALRVRGTVWRHMGDYENALNDLKNAQSIDYDESTDAIMKYVQARVAARQRRAVRQRNADERRAERRAAAAARQRQAAHRRAQAEYEAAHSTHNSHHASHEEDAEEDIYGSYPGAQAPRGAAGAGGAGLPAGLGAMFSDPELMAAMQNPEVSSKLMAALQNPASMASLMQDPKVGPLLTKLMSKMGGMGMGAGGPGAPRQHSHARAEPAQPASARPADDLD